MGVSAQPVVGYVKAHDGVNLAYQVVGEGPVDILWLPGMSYPFDLMADEPSFAHINKRLRSFSRTIWCETRGIAATGGNFRDVYERGVFASDVNAVLGAVGCDRATLVGTGIASSFAIEYSVEQSDRVSALIVIGGCAHYVREDDYPFGYTASALEGILALMRANWGTGAALEVLTPSRADDRAFREKFARFERLGQPPEEVAENLRLACLRDVRHLLPSATVPTLVLHRQGDRFIHSDAGRYVAERIPGARFVELPGDDALFFVGDVDALLDEIEEFLTGTHQGTEGDVVTSTILFTDIVASTEQAARLGHRNWTALTDQHDAMVRAALVRNRGREVKTTGDGFLAIFDSTSRAVRAATGIVTSAEAIGVEVRAGVHSGEVEVRPDDVVGLAVSIAKRICDMASPGEVLVSESVKVHLVGSGIMTEERGTHVLKGVPDEWRLFAVDG